MIHVKRKHEPIGCDYCMALFHFLKMTQLPHHLLVLAKYKRKFLEKYSDESFSLKKGEVCGGYVKKQIFVHSQLKPNFEQYI